MLKIKLLSFFKAFLIIYFYLNIRVLRVLSKKKTCNICIAERRSELYNFSFFQNGPFIPYATTDQRKFTRNNELKKIRICACCAELINFRS